MRYAYDPLNPPTPADLAAAWQDAPKSIRDAWTAWWERYAQFLGHAYWMGEPWGWLDYQFWGNSLPRRSPYAMACRNWKWQMLNWGWWDTEIIHWYSGHPEYSEPDLIPADGTPFVLCPDQFLMSANEYPPVLRPKFRIPKHYRAPARPTRRNL